MADGDADDDAGYSSCRLKSGIDLAIAKWQYQSQHSGLAFCGGAWCSTASMK